MSPEEKGMVLRAFGEWTYDAPQTALATIEQLLEARSRDARKKLQTAQLVAHAAQRQLQSIDSYRGTDEESRKAECTLTGQEA